MNSRLAAFALGTAAIAGFAVFAQQDDFSKVEIKTTKLSPTVSMMEGAGGNLAVSGGEDTTLLVDDQFAPLTPKIQAAIAKVAGKPVQYVLNTHWHFDHAGGNENFGRGGAVIVAHDNVRKRLAAGQMIEAFKMQIPAAPKVALPVVTFDGGMSFHINGEEVRVLHAPRAHTDGDALVHFTGSDVIHMGDTFFNGMYPFIDGSSGGTPDGVLAACDRVLGLATAKTRIIPGHGPLASRADLQAYRDMLATVTTRVKQAIAAGKTDEEIAKAGLTRDLDDKWGKGFLKPEAFVTIVAGTLRKG